MHFENPLFALYANDVPLSTNADRIGGYFGEKKGILSLKTCFWEDAV